MTARRIYQPYWLAYAAAHNETPDESRAKMLRPDGSFNGYPYMRWIQARWTTFRAQHPEHVTPRGSVTMDGHAAFAAWLAGGAS